jgi:hypothetical protein
MKNVTEILSPQRDPHLQGSRSREDLGICIIGKRYYEQPSCCEPMATSSNQSVSLPSE